MSRADVSGNARHFCDDEFNFKQHGAPALSRRISLFNSTQQTTKATLFFYKVAYFFSNQKNACGNFSSAFPIKHFPCANRTLTGFHAFIC